MGSPRRLEHNPSCIALNSLQFLDGAGRYAMKHSVTVVDLGQGYMLTSVLTLSIEDV